MAPSPASTASTAFAAFTAYLLLALLFGGRIPFVERRMFEFPSGSEPMVVPLFRADSSWATPWSYTDFYGIKAEDVDVEHRGYRCTVQQHFSEQRAWIEAHPAPEGAAPGPINVEIGVVILSPAEDGRVTVTERVDATGKARPRASE